MFTFTIFCCLFSLSLCVCVSVVQTLLEKSLNHANVFDVRWPKMCHSLRYHTATITAVTQQDTNSCNKWTANRVCLNHINVTDQKKKRRRECEKKKNQTIIQPNLNYKSWKFDLPWNQAQMCLIEPFVILTYSSCFESSFFIFRYSLFFLHQISSIFRLSKSMWAFAAC